MYVDIIGSPWFHCAVNFIFTYSLSLAYAIDYTINMGPYIYNATYNKKHGRYHRAFCRVVYKRGFVLDDY